MKNIKHLWTFIALNLLFFLPNAQTQCITGPLQLEVGQTATYTATGSAQCANCYDWDLNGIDNIANDQNQTYQFNATDVGTFTICVRTFDDTGDCDPCCITVVVTDPEPPLECCFDYWAVPKYFPACFTKCTGNLDNVWEIHQDYCGTLPDGYTSAFANITLNSPATLGNCQTCSSPITSQNGPVNSFNLAVCAPYNHSISFDIHIYDEDGNLVLVCEDEYFAFNVPVCGKGDPFVDGYNSDDSFALKIFPNPATNELNIESDKKITSLMIFDKNGQVMISKKNVSASNIDISSLEKGSYLFQCTYDDNTTQQLQFVKAD